MQYLGFLRDSELRGIGFLGLIILAIAVACWPRRRMSQLEVRAKDVLEAVDEMEVSIEALKEQKITLPREAMPAWIKLKTAGTYLKRLIEKGH